MPWSALSVLRSRWVLCRLAGCFIVCHPMLQVLQWSASAPSYHTPSSTVYQSVASIWIALAPGLWLKPATSSQTGWSRPSLGSFCCPSLLQRLDAALDDAIHSYHPNVSIPFLNLAMLSAFTTSCGHEFYKLPVLHKKVLYLVSSKSVSY